MRDPADRARHATAARLGDLLVRERCGPAAHVVRVRGAAPRVAGVAGPAPYLSVAHAGPHVVVALAPRPVGVDVEPADADAEAARAALGAATAAALDALPAAERAPVALRAWVRTEAVLKALGTGLALAPGRVTVPIGAAPIGWTAVAIPPDRGAPAVVVRDLDGPGGAVAALAIAGGPLTVTAGDGDAVLAGAPPA